MTQDEAREIIAELIRRGTQWSPQVPTPKQAHFLSLDCEEALFGGAAGGGKSSLLLMAALKYANIPGYSALILRRTYKDLSLPDAIMDRAHQWLRGRGAHWSNDTKTYTFPSSASLTFGYLDNENDKYRYQGSAFQFCVGRGTRVLMSDFSLRPIEDIETGEEVHTLRGSAFVTKTHRRGIMKGVVVSILDGHGSCVASQIQSTSHAVLTGSGDWASYDDEQWRGAVRQTPRYLHRDHPAPTQKYSRHKQLYAHPYTGEIHQIPEALDCVTLEITPSKPCEMYDITVGVSGHYITESGLINKNCGFDELTQFTESQYLYLHSRMRRPKAMDIPLRVRAASNPGGNGHDWVFRRFVESGNNTERVFIPALLSDNPHLDQEGYRRSLSRLDSITRRQLEFGEWIRNSGGRLYQFDRERNLTQTLPKVGAPPYVIGVDLGTSVHVPSTTFIVAMTHGGTIYITRAEAKAGMTPHSIGAKLRDLFEEYQPIDMVVDAGGLGRGYIEDFRAQYSLPVNAAQKENKLGYRKALNGDLEQGRLMVWEPGCAPLIEELESLEWNADGTDNNKGALNHCTDAMLYAWRAIKPFCEPPKAPGPAMGTAEYVTAEEQMTDDDNTGDEKAEEPWWG